MMMTEIQNKLEQDGFVVLEEFLWPEECEDLQVAAEKIIKDATDTEHRSIFSTHESRKQQLRDKYFLESNDKMRLFYEEGAFDEEGNLKYDESHSLNKIGHALHLLNPVFRCYTYCSRVKTVCEELGFEEPAVAQSMYIFKNPYIGGEVEPHQDSTYLYTTPKPPIGFWIALEDATMQNGCLWVVRGSHKSDVHRRLVRNSDNENEDGIPALVYDRPRPVYPESSFTPIPVNKGTCILIHGNVVHKSAPNKSEKSRHAYTFHVIETKNNEYSEDNWLQEGEDAPFCNLFTTRQMVFNSEDDDDDDDVDAIDDDVIDDDVIDDVIVNHNLVDHDVVDGDIFGHDVVDDDLVDERDD